MLTGNFRYLSEVEYEEYLFLRSYVQGWKLKKLLNRRNKIRNEVKSSKITPVEKEKSRALLEELKPAIKREAKEYWRRKNQLLAFKPEHTN